MLTTYQIDALRDKSSQLLDPIIEFLIEDIARRISEAGQLTGTASYQVWRLQKLGISQRQIKKELRKRLKVSHRELRRLLTQAAETGYNFDINRFPQVQAVPFSENSSVQQIVDTAVKMAQEDLLNITQTIGFICPDGKARPLTKAYQSACDFAFSKVVTGAQDFHSALRDATRGLAEKGILSIDYESGVHTSLEAAVRRNIMGALGLMQERISQQNHDDLGCDGWEISAHAGSAPDHEPIQGKQYTDKVYEKLNASLKRRIGTLNCGHSAFSIILGVNEPQYTPEELEQFRQENEAGVTYEGKHYTMYEATQRQRGLERSIRKQKRRILIDEAVGDTGKLQQDQIKLVRIRQEYKRFSDAAGLRMQHERMDTAGFTWKHGKAAESVAKTAEKAAKVAQEKERLLKSIKESGIIHKADVPLEQRGYTAEQYQDMLTKRTKVSLGGDISSLELDGTPNSITDLVRKDGRVKQRRVYGPTGKAVIDYDTDDHGKPKAHPTGAHKHLYNYNNKTPRGNPSPLTDGDLELNGDIIREGDNYHAPKTEKPD